MNARRLADKLDSMFRRGNDDDDDELGDRGISSEGPRTPGSGSTKTRRGGSGGGRPWTQFNSQSESGEKINYILRGTQATLLLICIFINVALTTFQQKHDVGPSGLVVFTFFIGFISFLTAVVLLLIPLVFERTGRLRGLARGVNQTRPSVLVNGSQTLLVLMLAFVLTISSNVKGCKDVNADPNAEREGYKEALPGFCSTKRALTAFLWFGFFAWLASLIICLINWRRTRSSGHIPGFIPPDADEFKGEDDEGDLEGCVPYSATGSGGGGGGGSGRDDGPAGSYASVPHSEGLSEPSTRYEPSILSSQSQGGYNPGGFAATAAAARQSGTFYEGGRPFEAATPTGFSNPYNPPSYEDPYERIRRERLGA